MSWPRTLLWTPPFTSSFWLVGATWNLGATVPSEHWSVDWGSGLVAAGLPEHQLLPMKWEPDGRGHAVDRERNPRAMTTKCDPTTAHVLEEPAELLQCLPDLCLCLNSVKNLKWRNQVTPTVRFKLRARAVKWVRPSFLLSFSSHHELWSCVFPIPSLLGAQNIFLAQRNRRLKRELREQNLPDAFSDSPTSRRIMSSHLLCLVWRFKKKFFLLCDVSHHAVHH